jgi:gamma-glutamyltranspeptidase/glutathione hydrolase/leukotriene-C4 hydrolase
MQSKEEAPLLAGEDQECEYEYEVERRSICQRAYARLRRTSAWSTDRPLPVHAGKTSPPVQKWKVVLLCTLYGALVLLLAAHFFLSRTPTSDSEARIRSPETTLPGWPPKRNTAYLIRATHGAVATENKLCSDIGVDVLKDGGNAVDAGIAATFCIGVVNMFRYSRIYLQKLFPWARADHRPSSGIGGGGFMTVRLPARSPNTSSAGWTVDFRETAPAAANATMFSHDPQSSLYGGLSVGVPGELRGLAEAHRRWATLSWKRLVEPAARLAEGWKVPTELGRRIQVCGCLARNLGC